MSNTSLICQNETCLKILDIETGSVVETIGDETGDGDGDDTIHTFTCNDKMIITAHKSGLLKLWRVDGGLEKMWKSIHKGPVSTMRIGSEEVLATGGSDGSVRLWNLKYQACTSNLRGSEGVISVVVFNGDQVFAAGDDAKINSWNVTKGERTCTYSGHFSKVTSVSFCHDGVRMVSTSRDKVVILWEVGNGKAIRTIPLFEAVESVIALPEKFKTPEGRFKNGIFVATAGEEGSIKIWDVENAKQVFSKNIVASAKPDSLSITKLLFNPETKSFATVTVDHNILLHNIKSFICTKQFVGFSDEILDVCFIGKDDTHLAVAMNSPDIKLYENATMNCQLLHGHTDIVLALARSAANPSLLLSSSKDNSIRLWKLENNQMTCIGIGAKHTGSVGSVALTQLTTAFGVSVSQDTCVKVWSISDTLECIHTEIAHQKDINCVTVSPNDKIIATASQDKLAKLWTEKLELIGVLRGHKRGIWCVRFSPIDQVVVTTSADCSVKLWSVTDLNCLKTIEGHESSVLRAEFLTNGLQIATAGADGFLKLFNVKSSECVATLDQHNGRIWALAVKSDETVIVSGGSDSLLIKWKDVTEAKKLEKRQQLEQLTAQEQQLSNLIHSNELLKALKLSLKLNRPFQTLKIIRNIIKQGKDESLVQTISHLSDDQKSLLLNCATTWNMNSKNCQPAQLVLNALINEMQSGQFRPAGLGSVIETTLPYTERHFKRLTQLFQDLHLVKYTINCMQPDVREVNE